MLLACVMLGRLVLGRLMLGCAVPIRVVPMRVIRSAAVRACAVLASAALVSNPAHATDPSPDIVTRLVAFPALPAGPLVHGIYRVPRARSGPVPAVVLLHGSAGIDSRGHLHALDLARSGIASLEIDMWGARGLAGGTARPPRVHDTLPDLWGALAWLAQRTDIDGDRLGALGFSWGGVMILLAATREHGAPAARHARPLRSAVAFYPVCWAYNRVPGYDVRSIADTRLLLLAGALDGYDDDPDACPALVASLPPDERARVDVHVYARAHHGFNMLEADLHYTDPYAHRGRGGDTVSRADPEARDDARARVVRHFVDTLGPARPTAAAH